ncbi:MAG TPA: HD domain-containing phosphohydrolase [Thermoanaerobaculia bacterium]|nr:HD domain-containing phosphohydrolase [Thermoanaerobaculia bacterium]
MLQAELEHRLYEQQTLLELGLALAETLEPQRVLALALEKAEEFCAAETSSIWEVDDAAGELFFRVVRGRAAREIAEVRVRIGEGIVGSVAQTGVAERIEDVAADPRWHGEISPSFDTHAVLAVPLVSRGRVVGVLQLLNTDGRGGFTEEDLRRMRLFAGPLAHALENARLFARLEATFVESVTALAEAVERRDPYTGGHLLRVVAYSVLLGDDLDLPPDELETLRLGATLHDIGKIAVPDDILRKPSGLDPEEAATMRRHVIDGAEIVGRIASLAPIVPIVRNHHERMDGKGYPDGLAGEAIPLLARIVAVADTFDAITTSRPYRPGLEPARAASEIRADAGSRLCPTVVAAFERVYRSGRFEVSAGERIAASLSARRRRE